jgi:DNA-binding MarR family transcriptional regulator
MNESDEFVRTRAATEKGFENWEEINAFHEQMQREMIGRLAADEQPENPHAAVEAQLAERRRQVREASSRALSK